PLRSDRRRRARPSAALREHPASLSHPMAVRSSDHSEGEYMRVSAIVIAGSLLLPAGAYAQSVNDAQIAPSVVTANQVDVDAGKLAASTSKNAEIKKFAQ